MARGNYSISLDAKGRMAIPTKQREDIIQQSQGKMVVTISPQDRCLWLYCLSTWEVVERKFINLPTLNTTARNIKDMMLGHACDCEMDAAGRILVPANLRDLVALNKKAVLVGLGDKFAIWSEERWNARLESLLNTQISEEDIPDEMRGLAF